MNFAHINRYIFVINGHKKKMEEKHCDWALDLTAFYRSYLDLNWAYIEDINIYL